MCDISERLTVCSSVDAGLTYLARFMSEHSPERGRSHVTFRLSASECPQALALSERRVHATLYPLGITCESRATYLLTWILGEAYPQFAGALAIEKFPADPRTFGLIVSGYYEAVSDVEGAAASETLLCSSMKAAARKLLRAIAAYVEDGVAHNAAARASRPVNRQAHQRATVQIG
jgi:hypothetical protein